MSWLRWLSPNIPKAAVNPPAPCKWASAYLGSRGFIIQTHSGYRSSALDPAGKTVLLTRDCSDEELGTALLNALAASRMLTLKQTETFFAVAELQERYNAWVAGLLQHYKLKTKKTLFTGMDNCHVTEREGVVSINPTAHQRLEGWVRTKGMNLPTLTVAANASAEDIGARLREAFSHCIARDWGG